MFKLPHYMKDVNALEGVQWRFARMLEIANALEAKKQSARKTQ